MTLSSLRHGGIKLQHLTLQEVSIEAGGQRVTIGTTIEQGDKCLSHQLGVDVGTDFSTLYCTTEDLIPYLLFASDGLLLPFGKFWKENGYLLDDTEISPAAFS